MDNYPIHPVAEIFPIDSEDALKRLAADIKQNGLREPLELHEGHIVDGRNRLRACGMARVEPRYTEAVIGSGGLFAYVLSKNLHRRQLSVSQRAYVAASLAELAAGPAQQRKLEAARRNNERRHGAVSPDLGYRPQPFEISNMTKGKATEYAAKALGISRGTVENARALKVHAPEVFERVGRGEITVDGAYSQFVEGKTEQAQKMQAKARRNTATKTPAKRNPRREVTAKRIFGNAVDHIHGLCEGLLIDKLVDVPILVNALSPEEMEHWFRQLQEARRFLKQMENKLREHSNAGHIEAAGSTGQTKPRQDRYGSGATSSHTSHSAA